MENKKVSRRLVRNLAIKNARYACYDLCNGNIDLLANIDFDVWGFFQEMIEFYSKRSFIYNVKVQAIGKRLYNQYAVNEFALDLDLF